MSIRADLRETLEADATLTGILTGGIYDASELGVDGLTPEAAPSAFTGARLKPCALIRFGTMSQTEIVGHSKRRFFQIYFYQQVGHGQIDLASARCRVLLHPHKQFETSGGLFYFTTYVSSGGDMIADELGGVAMSFDRYYFDSFE